MKDSKNYDEYKDAYDQFTKITGYKDADSKIDFPWPATPFSFFPWRIDAASDAGACRFDGYVSEKTFGVVIYWEPTNHDNDYNANNDQETSDGEPLFVELGVNVIATQKDYEKDSFDNQYDRQAPLNSLASMLNVEAKGKIKASIEATDGNIIIEDEGGTKVTATIPSATVNDFMYSGVDENGTEFEMKSSDANEEGHDDTLILTIKTDKVEADSITYDISMVNDTHKEKIKQP